MDRPGRIAFLSEHASPIAVLGGADAGGQNVYVDEVSRNLARRGYLVDVFTRRADAEVPEITEWAPGVRVIQLVAGPVAPCPKDELWPYMPAFRDALLAFCAHHSVQYDLLHGNFWMSGWVASELGERLGIPVVQIFHAMGMTKRRHQQQVDTSPGNRIQVEKEIIRRVDRIIAQCPSERDELLSDYYAEPHKVVLIPSAVNTKVFYPVPKEEARQRLGLSSHDFLITYVGRLLPRKDVRNIVRALPFLRQRLGSQFQQVKLLIVGGETVEPDPQATPEIGELQQLAQELGVLERLSFIGKRQQDTLRDYYSAGDVAVTTPWYEPFGLTPLEGMACGRPVIGSAVGGITFTILDGETGLLVPPRDPESLANRLYHLQQDPALRTKMGLAARQRVEQDFTWPIVAMRTASLYELLIMQGKAFTSPLPTRLDSSSMTGE